MRADPIHLLRFLSHLDLPLWEDHLYCVVSRRSACVAPHLQRTRSIDLPLAALFPRSPS